MQFSVTSSRRRCGGRNEEIERNQVLEVQTGKRVVGIATKATLLEIRPRF